jgi:aspartyl-tRNA(Asn)/glutamyl-tRNA(Gln) amidotransferase subunit A
LQVIGRHFTEQLLLDIALTAERSHPWPLVAPGAPS